MVDHVKGCRCNQCLHAPTLEAVVTVDAQAGEPVAADRTPVVALDRPELLIGRNSDIQDVHPEIALDEDPGVSRRHAKLVRADDGSYVLADLGSSNGTILNGTKVAPGARAPVKSGDEIKLGRWTAITVRARQ